jgi:hypothetical protein
MLKVVVLVLGNTILMMFNIGIPEAQKCYMGTPSPKSNMVFNMPIP